MFRPHRAAPASGSACALRVETETTACRRAQGVFWFLSVSGVGQECVYLCMVQITLSWVSIPLLTRKNAIRKFF